MRVALSNNCSRLRGGLLFVAAVIVVHCSWNVPALWAGEGDPAKHVACAGSPRGWGACPNFDTCSGSYPGRRNVAQVQSDMEWLRDVQVVSDKELLDSAIRASHDWQKSVAEYWSALVPGFQSRYDMHRQLLVCATAALAKAKAGDMGQTSENAEASVPDVEPAQNLLASLRDKIARVGTEPRRDGLAAGKFTSESLEKLEAMRQFVLSAAKVAAFGFLAAAGPAFVVGAAAVAFQGALGAASLAVASLLVLDVVEAIVLGCDGQFLESAKAIRDIVVEEVRARTGAKFAKKVAALLRLKGIVPGLNGWTAGKGSEFVINSKDFLRPNTGGAPDGSRE